MIRLLTRIICSLEKYRLKYTAFKKQIKSVFNTWLTSSLLFFVCFFCSVIFFCTIRPHPEEHCTRPELQISKHNSRQFTAVYQNQPLKHELCSGDTTISSQNYFSKDQFCHFSYPALPASNAPVDIALAKLQADSQTFINICLTRKVSINTYRHMCQRYLAFEGIGIANDLLLDQIYSVEIQIESTSVGIRQLLVTFKQQQDWFHLAIADYYSCFVLLFSIFLATVVAVLNGFCAINAIVQQKAKQSGIPSDKNY